MRGAAPTSFRADLHGDIILITYGSVCSGIEAATVAWHPFGWKAAWLAEIEKFPSQVLAHHYPETPNLGDMTKIAAQVLSQTIQAPDVLVGGTPCQAFSVAGLRKSLEDDRGQLSISFIHLADAIDAVRRIRGEDPVIVVWENVPGVLSTKDNAFGCFLAGLAGEDSELLPAGKRWTDAGCVYGPQRTVAWRVLDAQYFGVAQRRRRVFVVASARDGFDPGKVLFEPSSGRRDNPPSRTQREDVTGPITAGISKGCRGTEGVDSGWAIPTWPAEVASTLNAAFGDKQGLEDQHALNGAPLFVPVMSNDPAHAICANEQKTYTNEGSVFQLRNVVGQVLPFDTTQVTSPSNYSNPQPGDPCHQLAAGAHVPAVATPMQVRRLTPVECERLQGFGDNYTDIKPNGKPTPDGPRYKALGNSMAVPVMRWIGRRIDDAIIASGGAK